MADYAGPYFDVDLQIPIIDDKFGVAAGFGRKDDEFPDGTNSSNRTTAVLVEERPIGELRLRSFWTQIVGKNVEAQPVLTVAGAWLPPPLQIRNFIGQKWAANEHHITNTGVLADVELGGGWMLRTGLFRSVVKDLSNFADIFRNVQRDGTADNLIVADPIEGTRSTSGELRLSRLLNDGPRKHLVYVVLRGRQRSAEFGGSDQVDFGPSNVTAPRVLQRPDFAFSTQNQDRVRQFTAGVAYEGYWDGLGQIGVGIQKTQYRKTFEEPGIGSTQTKASPLLFFGSLEVRLSKRLAVFGGVTRGLEETGIAPDNAANRGQALAAARTRQIDAGLSYALTGSLKIVAAAFDIRKPYFNLDPTNLYTKLGTERHRGAEFSLTGAITPRLSVVAGAVFLDARTTGSAITGGRLGKRPINSSPLVVRFNAEYSVPFFKGLSIDLGIDHDGSRIASASNVLKLPARTTFRTGARYRFRLNHLNAQLRILVDNIADHFSWVLTSGGGFKVDAGRRVTGYLAIDL